VPVEFCTSGSETDWYCEGPALQLAGVAVVPANAVQEARSVASIALSASGDQGAIVELSGLLKAANR